MESSLLRIRVAVVGTLDFRRIRVDTSADDSAARQQLITIAAEKLGATVPTDGASNVRLYFSGGDPVEECSMLEKDDDIWLAFDGGAWREPEDAPAGDSPSHGLPPAQPGPSLPSDAMPKASATALLQPSIGSLMGSGTKREFEHDDFGRRVEKRGPPQFLTPDELAATPTATAGACLKCGRTFTKAGPMKIHVDSCKGPGSAAAAATAATAAAATAAASTSSASASSSSGPSGSADAAEETAPPPTTKAKPRKDGKAKQSGLREGDVRNPNHTLYFRLEVVKKFREFERLRKIGRLVGYPGKATSAHFNGLSEANITRWKDAEDKIRGQLLHEHASMQPKAKHKGKLVPFSSRGARRLSLHRGVQRPFAAAEVELHAEYRVRRRGDGASRKGGERVTGHWFRIRMKQLVRQHYGDDAADGFKASPLWLRGFARCFGISLRAKSNSRAEAIEVRLPKIRRWHARLRRRLKRGPSDTLDSKWGRWKPENRLAGDQVGCNLRAGLQRTYDEKGSKRIWMAGAPADDGKRFMTLNMLARAKNGDASKPRRGQPKLGIIFRGKGQKRKAAEIAGYHPDVNVRFQKKAWADDELCEAFAYKEVCFGIEPVGCAEGGALWLTAAFGWTCIAAARGDGGGPCGW
jgi:hypothetical protein